MTAAAKQNDEPIQLEEPILDLEEYANPDRPTVLFRTEEERDEGKPGVRYEVRIPEDMGVEEEQLYRSEIAEYTELMRKRTLNKAERAKLVQRLSYLFDKALIAPPEIKAKFNDRQKQAVITLFTTALFTADAAAVEKALPLITPQMAREVGSTTES